MNWKFHLAPDADTRIDRGWEFTSTSQTERNAGQAIMLKIMLHFHNLLSYAEYRIYIAGDSSILREVLSKAHGKCASNRPNILLKGGAKSVYADAN